MLGIENALPSQAKSKDPLPQEVPSSIKLTTKCAKCQQELRAGVEYRNQIWHRQCLTCCYCEGTLAGTKFTNIDGKPCCIPCYGDLFAYKCAACTFPIYGFDDGFLVILEGRRWHLRCFRCHSCETPLIGEITFNGSEGVLCQVCAAQ